ncbi:hypothetical protein PNH50_12355 [Leisingera aquaemixtae]|uniref:hypothetical protein n=1 Tax=Leisingera aquaemixtae TaxID=1396826 RepID=UPI003983E11F
MKNPNATQKVVDHIRAFLWAGRPVLINYADRKKYFRENPDNFGGGDGEIIDGNCKPGIWLSRIRIFLPLLEERLVTLRHEAAHVRFRFVPHPPEALAEARRLFKECEPEVAALYEAQGKDVSGEAVVRLADRVRYGQYVPQMSGPLKKLVAELVAPARLSALNFVLRFVIIAATALAALLSLLPASVSASSSWEFIALQALPYGGWSGAEGP